MNNLQLELTSLIGKKKLTLWAIVTVELEDETVEWVFIKNIADSDDTGSWYVSFFRGITIQNSNDEFEDLECFESDVEIIGHPATLSDFHKWMNDMDLNWSQEPEGLSANIVFNESWDGSFDEIEYDTSLELLDQEEEILKQIIALIKSIWEKMN